MIIIVENATDRVKYAFPDTDAFTLDESGLRWSGGRDLHLTALNAASVDVTAAPTRFRGDVWAWRNDAFEVDSQDAYDALLDDAKAARLAELADIRWQHEVGGTTVPGIGALTTDRESQGKLTAAYVKAQADPAFEISDWKVSNGVFVTLDAATVIIMGDAIAGFVQACFSREKSLSDEIMAAVDLDALAAIDLNAGWPGGAS